MNALARIAGSGCQQTRITQSLRPYALAGQIPGGFGVSPIRESTERS